jgi:hypothetical protein
MLKIDRLTLRVPGELGSRTDQLVSLVGRELAAVSWPESRAAGRVRLPPLEVDPALSDRQIAARIAASVQHALDRMP